jgi:hypothetical protein
MRESEELITAPLRPSQIAILLRMFIAAANIVTNEKKSFEAEDGGNSREKERNIVHSRWESLNTTLIAKLPLLLTRFKDEEANVNAICDLLRCCDISTATVGNNLKAIKTLVKNLEEIFLSFHHEICLKNILHAFSSWSKLRSSVSAASSSSGNSSEFLQNNLKYLFSQVWERLTSDLGQLNTLVAALVKEKEKDTMNSTKGKRKSSSSKVN